MNCPVCHHDIDHLLQSSLERTTSSVFRWSDDEKLSYEETDLVLVEPGTYDCPVCYAPLFRTEAEALTFLKLVED